MAIGDGETIGEVSMDVTANVEHFPHDVEKGVERATTQVDPELKKAGDKWGNTLSESMGKRLETDAKEVGSKFTNALGKETIRPKIKIKPDVDVDRDPVAKAIRGIIADVEGELENAAGPGGIFNIFGKNIGQAIQDGVGSVFNVSGKSPLITLLIPVFAALGGLILGALQAVSALGALIATLPAILLGVGSAALALYAAFRGMGTAIQAAFAAKNAKELKEALKDLTPGAQEFVRNLLPLRDIFNDISKVSQQEFFKRAAPAVKILVDTLRFAGPYIEQLAITMGTIADKFGGIFSDPAFRYFLALVLNDTSNWLHDFGDAIITVVNGFRDLATTAEPFLRNFGVQFNMALTGFGDFLTQLANDPATKKFFDDMQYDIAAIFGLLKSATNFVLGFLNALNSAGGTRLITAISNVLDQWTFILQGQGGVEVMKGFVNAGVAAIYIVGGLVSALLIFVADLQLAAEAVEWLGGEIGDFFDWVGKKWQEFWDPLSKGMASIGTTAMDTFNNVKNSISNTIDNAVAFVRNLPQRAADALGNLGQTLYNKGASLLQGFINGIASKLPNVANIAKSAIHALTDFFPGSPAKTGPLSGQGYSMLRGQRMMQDFAKGISLGTPMVAMASNSAVSTISFGPGAVNANFYGSTPTPDQAQSLGSSVGTGIGNMLAARDARAAIRSL
jgi:hypothetical protein